MSYKVFLTNLNEKFTSICTNVFKKLQIADFLVNKGANLHMKDNMGLTPLDIARQSLNEQLSALLELATACTTDV